MSTRIAVHRKKVAPRRKVARAVRRTQLIEATIAAVARHGLAETTMSIVSRQAGLSQGIINLHFESKDKLLVATLEYLADEYRAAWEQALADAGEAPDARLAALVEVDFAPALCDRKKLAVWFAFWGASKSRPTYLRLCKRRDLEYDAVLLDVCQQMAQEGRYPHVDAEIVANSLAALTDGLWLDLLVKAAAITPERAREISYSYLAAVFPRHFDGRGCSGQQIKETTRVSAD